MVPWNISVSMLIGSAVLVGLKNVTNIQINRSCYSACSNRPHLMHWIHAMLPNNNKSRKICRLCEYHKNKSVVLEWIGQLADRLCLPRLQSSATHQQGNMPTVSKTVRWLAVYENEVLTWLRRSTDMVVNQLTIYSSGISHRQWLVFLHLAAEHPTNHSTTDPLQTHT